MLVQTAVTCPQVGYHCLSSPFEDVIAVLVRVINSVSTFPVCSEGTQILQSVNESLNGDKDGEGTRYLALKGIIPSMGI